MSVLAQNSQVLCREIYHQIQIQRDQTQQSWFGGNCSVLLKSYGLGFDRKGGERKKMAQRRDLKASAFWQDSSRPTTIEMEPILDSDQLDQILLKSKDLSQPIIIEWMASWCRKCIYLKPKLEKLAAEFDPKMKFYCVDVNKVPQALVKRGNISKMPTIQLWKDGEMKEEVIGGHKAWLVLDEVREMIHKFV